MPSITPRHTKMWALRVVYVATPLSALCLVGWGLDLVAFGHTPPLLFVAYQLLAMVSLGAGIIATVAAGQLAIAKAFAAGYMAGVQRVVTDGNGDDDHPKHRGRPRNPKLRAVE